MTRLRGPELEDFEARTGWVGCPHCGGPVNARLLEARAVEEAMARLLVAHQENPSVEALVEAIRALHVDAAETAEGFTRRPLDDAIELHRIATAPRPRRSRGRGGKRGVG